MPQINIGDFDIYYEIRGSGFPLLMLNGFGLSLLDWGDEFPVELAKHYQVIMFDGRETGLTISRSTLGYTIADLAEDAVSLLDALEINQAHFLGVSMGGMVAQQIALRYPFRLGKLILGCTVMDGSTYIPPSVTSFLGMTVIDQLFTPEYIATHQVQMNEFLQQHRSYQSRPWGLLRQLQAISTHDVRNLIGEVQVPTLVLTGDRDSIIPPQKSHLLAQGISGAKQQIIQGGGHGFYLSHSQETVRAIVQFLNDTESVTVSASPEIELRSYSHKSSNRIGERR